MARKIRPLSEITEAVPSATAATDAPTGVVFVNNYLNREFVLPNQAKFKFQTSRQLFTDPAQIEHLRKLIAENVNSRIFEEVPEPVAEEIDSEEAAPEPVADPVIEPTPEPPVTE